MSLMAPLVCLALIPLAAVAAAVVWKAQRIKARHRRFAAAPSPASAASVPLFEAQRALYHGTGFQDGTALLIRAWRDPCVCDVTCTAEALFLVRQQREAMLAIPLDAVDEAALHRSHARLAGKDLPMLRLRWTRGGEKLVTNLSLRGGMSSLEVLRRIIHLRQGNVEAQLRPLIERQP
jgi:hypothetical protein